MGRLIRDRRCPATHTQQHPAVGPPKEDSSSSLFPSSQCTGPWPASSVPSQGCVGPGPCRIRVGGGRSRPSGAAGSWPSKGKTVSWLSFHVARVSSSSSVVGGSGEMPMWVCASHTQTRQGQEERPAEARTLTRGDHENMSSLEYTAAWGGH